MLENVPIEELIAMGQGLAPQMNNGGGSESAALSIEILDKLQAAEAMVDNIESCKTAENPTPISVAKKLSPVMAGKRLNPVMAGKRLNPVMAGKRLKPVMAGKRSKTVESRANPQSSTNRPWLKFFRQGRL